MFDTLREIGADQVPALLLFNKSDLPAASAALPELLRLFPQAAPVSAIQHAGLTRIKELIAAHLPR